MKARDKAILEAAIESLVKCEDPFHESFLTKHDVTLEEADTLAQVLAMSGRIYLQLCKPEWDRVRTALVMGAFITDDNFEDLSEFRE